MRYAVQLKKDAANYSGRYVTLVFVNGKHEGDINRPDVVDYLIKTGHQVNKITDESTSVSKKTSRKKKEA